MLRQEGWHVNAKRVYRLWRREGLKVPQKKRKRRRLGTSENGCHRRRAEHKDHVWCWDFVFDRTTSGSPLKWLSIVDEYTRECLALEGGPQHHQRGRDRHAGRAVRDARRAAAHPQRQRSGVHRPGDPALARAGGRRDAVHRAGQPRGRTATPRASTAGCATSSWPLEVFESLAAARQLTAAWREDYNHHRPHSSLGYLTPAEFAARCAASAPKSLRLRLKLLLRSSSTAELPNPYSHSTWYRIWGRRTG